MDAAEIHKHWTDWATRYGADLRATTRASTPKVLEIDALTRRLRAISSERPIADVLEIGCGNGVNCFALAHAFPQLKFDGVDFVAEMVVAARERAAGLQGPMPRFFTGNVLELAAVEGLRSQYDVVFTDRCLINLNTTALQKQAIASLAARLRPDGHLVLIENSTTTYGKQNECREILGLPARAPASFNFFFDEAEIRAHVQGLGLELAHVEDFSSLHDLLLYALIPATNGGTVDYEHPLVKIATMLSIGISATTPSSFGPFGQNRLFHWRKPA